MESRRRRKRLDSSAQQMLFTLVVAELQTQRGHELNAFGTEIPGGLDRLEQRERPPQLRTLFGRPRLVAIAVRDDDVEIDLVSLVDDVAVHATGRPAPWRRLR